MSQDAWLANLSDGTTVVEYWAPNELSPWLRLMELCRSNGLYLTNLRLTICSKTIALKPHAQAYWQAHQRTLLSGGGEVPISRGIGFVDNNIIKIIWGVRTSTGQPHFYQEQRPVDREKCIIWKTHKIDGGING